MTCNKCGGRNTECDECGGLDARIAERRIRDLGSVQKPPKIKSPSEIAASIREEKLREKPESPQGELFYRR